MQVYLFKFRGSRKGPVSVIRQVSILVYADSEKEARGHVNSEYEHVRRVSICTMGAVSDEMVGKKPSPQLEMSYELREKTTG